MMNKLDMGRVADTKAAMRGNAKAGLKQMKVAGEWSCQTGRFRCQLPPGVQVELRPDRAEGGVGEDLQSVPSEAACLFGFSGCITGAYVLELSEQGVRVEDFQTTAEALIDWKEGGISQMRVLWSCRTEKPEALAPAVASTWDTCPAAFLVGRANPVAISVSAQVSEAPAGSPGNGLHLEARAAGEQLQQQKGQSRWTRVSRWGEGDEPYLFSTEVRYGVDAHAPADLDAVLARVVASARDASDVVLLMSNGDFGGLHDRVLAALALREKLETSP